MWHALCLLVLLLPRVALALGATVTVQNLNPQTGSGFLQIVNTSDKPTTGFTVKITVTNANGRVPRSRYPTDYGPLVAPLAPGHTAEEPQRFQTSKNNPV